MVPPRKPSDDQQAWITVLASVGAVALLLVIAAGVVLIRRQYVVQMMQADMQRALQAQAAAARAQTQVNAADNQPPATPDWTAPLIETLIGAGWTTPAAQAVVQLNQEYFSILRDEDPPQLLRAINVLKRLGARRELLPLVAQHPEIAGLLASSAEPRAVAASFRHPDRFNEVANLYARHGVDAERLADALERHGELICQLTREGLPGAESVFLFARDSPGAEQYDAWLGEAMRIAASEEGQLAAVFQLVLIHGDALRRMLIDDPALRDQFRDEIWPRLLRLVSKGRLTIEQAAWDLNLFRLLANPRGERLVDRWGLLPLEVLYGPQAYPEPLRETLVDVMLRGDNSTLGALLQYGREPLFVELLGRTGLTPDVQAAALGRLRAAGSDYPRLLERYSRLSPTALAEDVGPPPSGPVTWLPLYYTVYEVPKKIMQGRNPTLIDGVIAVADPVFLLLGPLGPDDIVKVVGQQSVQAGARQTATRTAAAAVSTAARSRAAAQVGEQAARQMVTQEAAPWLISQTLRSTRQALTRKLTAAMTVDITGPTRWLCRVSGASPVSLRQLTALQARLFMRPDGRVLIRLDRFLLGHPAGRFLADTAVAGMVETGMEVPAIEGAVVGAAHSLQAMPAATNIRPLAEKFSNWQRNMAAWWLIQATGWADELAASAN